MWWLFIIWGLVSILFVLVMLETKLYRFSGTRFRTRVYYSLGLSLFFTLFFLGFTGGSSKVLIKSVLLGIVLSIPFYFFSKNWIKKRIEGTTMYYKRRQYLRNLMVGVPTVVLVMIFLHSLWGKQVIDAGWPMLGLCISWFVSQLFLLLDIMKLEKKLGRPIVEEQKQ